ncbi:MAG: SDR family oxidoreductase [Candidatus Neomarinimicrobiota bacterium]
MSNNSKVILITGTSSGIGKASAEYLTKQGYTVFGTSRYPGSYAVPENYTMLQMDVTDETTIANAIAKIIDTEGRLDVLINNAGIHVAGSIEETPIEKSKEQVEANFFGIHRMCKAVIPYMREQQNGYIINISSIMGVIALPYQGFYSASKFALEGMAEALRSEVRSFGIKVCLIEPGDVHIEPAHKRWKTPLSDESPYYSPFKRVMNIVERDEDHGISPVKIAHLINNIIKKDNPKLRYTVGAFDQRLAAFLKRILPNRLFDWIIMKYYKII